MRIFTHWYLFYSQNVRPLMALRLKWQENKENSVDFLPIKLVLLIYFTLPLNSMEIRRYFLFCLSSLTSTVPLKSFGNKSFIHLFHSDGDCSCFPGFILFYLVRFQCTMCDGFRLHWILLSINSKKNKEKNISNCFEPMLKNWFYFKLLSYYQTCVIYPYL